MRLTRWLYLRALGAVALIAVGSFWAQLSGLIGSEGVWPAADQMRQLHQTPELGFFDVPTLAWLSVSDGFLHLLAGGCLALAVLLMVGVAPRLVLGLLWLGWLSLVHVGGPFLSFQWDVLLLEALFFSIPFAPGGWWPSLKTQSEPSGWSRFLLQWLVFKLTFSSGVVKLASGDPSWRNLTALSYHYWTQPLPTWSSYFAHQWPLWVHQLCCLGMFICELPVALLALGPRKARLIAAVGLLSLQLALSAAGNYSYFNLLSIALCVPLIDDATVRWLVPKWRLPQLPARPDSRRLRTAGIGFAVVYAVTSALVFLRGGEGYPRVLQAALSAIYPFSTVNSYGAFAVMTKTRAEIVLEASSDGVRWAPWEFKYKPGRVDRRPQFVAPWQPRLDWQMWFAALSDCRSNPWLLSLQYRLLQGSAPVRELLGDAPPGPVSYVRTMLWDYRFAPPGEKGVWWNRENPRPFCPELMLDPEGRLRVR
jgi:hypothetical protein